MRQGAAKNSFPLYNSQTPSCRELIGGPRIFLIQKEKHSNFADLFCDGKKLSHKAEFSKH